MAIPLGIASLIVFLLSLVAHLATFAPAPTIPWDAAWLLHFAIFPVFGAMVISLAILQKKMPKTEADGLLAKWIAQNRQGTLLMRKVVAAVPYPLLALCLAFFVYAIVNFASYVNETYEGSPVEDASGYHLDSHGERVRDLSREEYQRYLAYEVRGFSGHWMIFSLLPTVYFLVVRPKLETPEDRSQGSSPSKT